MKKTVEHCAITVIMVFLKFPGILPVNSTASCFFFRVFNYRDQHYNQECHPKTVEHCAAALNDIINEKISTKEV